MKKRMIIMLILLAILFGGIFGYKLFVAMMTKRFFASMKSPAVTVSTMKVSYANWKSSVAAVGSLRAIKGVEVTSEIAGMVTKIYFSPGAFVKEGMNLVQLNADVEIAQLLSLEANQELAKITYQRDKSQYAIHAVSKATLDVDVANLKSLQAQVNQQKAVIAKKTIRAPFSGRLGISYVNPGQYVNPGDKVVALQTLNPIYVDFNVPQQILSLLKVGQEVSVSSDTFKSQLFTGKLTTINPFVDSSTRNIEVEATVDNPNNQLLPGMFVNLIVVTGSVQRFLTVPQAAISFNSFGDIIYIVKDAKKDEQGKPVLIANQSFVTTGEKRGDQITILKGLSVNDIIVTSGQLKLKNGSRVIVNNAIQPPNSIYPNVPDEHQG